MEILAINRRTKTFNQIAMEWLKKHYPDKRYPIDIRWSAVINFAIYLDGKKEN